jgi:adenine phosphoribosyltransferase
MNLDPYLRDVPDFPAPGIVFKDISPLLADPVAFGDCIAALARAAEDLDVTRVAGIESRGFLFGMPLAQRLGVGFTPIRKPGKLPWQTSKVEYELEYGSDVLEIHNDGVAPGQRVLIVDDLLATGGTAAAACELVQLIGGKVAACAFAIELTFLDGRSKLAGQRVIALHSI